MKREDLYATGRAKDTRRSLPDPESEPWCRFPNRLRLALWRQGLTTAELLPLLPDSALRAMPGVGPKLIEAFRKVFPYQDPAGGEVPAPVGAELQKVGEPGGHGVAKGAAWGAITKQLRERSARSFDERIPVLEQIADGEAVQKTSIPLPFLLPYVRCPECGDKLKLQEGIDPKDAIRLEIEATISASPKDRISALDTLGKYGPGTRKEVENAVELRAVKVLIAELARVTERYVTAPAAQEELLGEWKAVIRSVFPALR